MAQAVSPGDADTVAARFHQSLGQTSVTLRTALVVLRLRDEYGSDPTVREVAAFFGLSKDATYNRLLSAVGAGWLRHREKRHGAFSPSAQLYEHLASSATSADDQ